MSLVTNHLTIHKGNKEFSVNLPENYDSIYVYGGCDRQVSVIKREDNKFEVTTVHKSVEDRVLV